MRGDRAELIGGAAETEAERKKVFHGGITMELKDTINLMRSEDYKERFAAEY